MASRSSSTLESLSHQAVRQMFEARKRVFVDILKWDIPVLEGRYEIDQFDTPDADYLILTGATAAHRASARLLRTDRAHILGQLFPELCDEAAPSGATTREITRFCIDPVLDRAQRREARNQLVSALVDHALRSGITDYTAVASIAWYRQIMGFGWKCRATGPKRFIGGENVIGLHIEIDPQTPQDLSATGIYRSSPFMLAAAGAVQ